MGRNKVDRKNQTTCPEPLKCSLDNSYPDLASLYSMLREQIQHEDSLVNQRITWLLATEAFLFAGFGAILVSEELPEHQKLLFLLVIGFFGAFFSVLSAFSIHAAFDFLKILREKWTEAPVGNEHVIEKWSSVRKKYPPITYAGHWGCGAGFAAYGFPCLIFFIWLLLVLIIRADL